MMRLLSSVCMGDKKEADRDKMQRGSESETDTGPCPHLTDGERGSGVGKGIEIDEDPLDTEKI